MNPLLLSQAAAQFGSLFVYIMMTRWHVAPWLRTLSRADALIALLWIHVFRYVALQTYSAQHSGFPISDQGMRDIVLGDVGGAILAFLAIALLQMRSRLGLLLAAILVVETAYDTVTNIHGGIQEHLLGAASGPTWFILAFYVPAVVVSAVLIAWQLLSRYRESLIASTADKGGRQKGSLSLLGLHRVFSTFARLVLPLGAGLLATSALARVTSRTAP